MQNIRNEAFLEDKSAVMKDSDYSGALKEKI